MSCVILFSAFVGPTRMDTAISVCLSVSFSLRMPPVDLKNQSYDVGVGSFLTVKVEITSYTTFTLYIDNTYTSSPRIPPPPPRCQFSLRAEKTFPMG